MRHLATPRFWACYQGLPAEVQRLADRCYELLRQDPQHPSLHFKKVGRFWSARVGLPYRAPAVLPPRLRRTARTASGPFPAPGGAGTDSAMPFPSKFSGDGTGCA